MAGIAHAHATHFEQVVGTRFEQGRVDGRMLEHIFLSQYRAAGGHLADQRQTEFACRRADRILRTTPPTNAARSTRQQFDQPFSLERLQMLFGGVERTEPEGARDLFACRWRSAGGQRMRMNSRISP